MKNIIVLTHGNFSKGILQSCYIILGEIKNAVAISISLNGTLEEMEAMIEREWEVFHNNFPTVIVTDLPGGSTTHAALRWAKKHKDCYILSGVNFGMLLELILVEFQGDMESNKDAINKIVDNAKQQIMYLDEIPLCETENLEGEL